MGSWNGTCMISNLPILYGEKVKLVFLHRPYIEIERKINFGDVGNTAYCYPNGIFHVGAFPLDAEYNDYGSVENIKKDVNYNLIEKYFKTKYKKIKIGKKIYDEITIEDVLDGITQGNLKVFSSDDWTPANYACVMIRTDVWDYICKHHKTEFWKDREDRETPDDYYQTAQEWVADRFDKYINESDGITSEPFKKWNNPLRMEGFAGGNVMFMNDEYYLAFDENIEYFKNAFTEFILIESFLSNTRRGWMIVSGGGSQNEGWEAYMMLNKVVDMICQEKIKEYEQEEDEEEQE